MTLSTHLPVLAVALLTLLLALPAQAQRPDTAIRDAAALRKQLRYDDAAARLDTALPGLTGDTRSRALVARAGLVTEPKRAQALLQEGSRVATTPAVRRRADLELARLDLARGSYGGARTRLAPWAEDPEAAVLLGQAAVGVESFAGLDSILAPAGDDEVAVLLRGWAALQTGQPGRALQALTPLAQRRSSDVLPTALLWKATAEAQLGDAAAATRTASELRTRFAAAPETDAAARAAQASPIAPESATRDERCVLQIAAFEDRANALRHRETVARDLTNVRVEAGTVGGRTVYRVCVGSFASRAAAETYAHAELDPRGIAWQIAVPERERR